MYQEVLEKVYTEILTLGNLGKTAQYIPELSKINPEYFGASLLTTKGETFSIGDSDTSFSIQSISKVLSLSLAYGLIGEDIFKRVNVEPSGNPFNSLIQLENDNGIPRNPFINAGAIVICDILLSHLENPKDDFLSFVNKVCEGENIDYSFSIADSEKSVGYRNVALCNYIKALGNIENNPEQVLDFYFLTCSVMMNTHQLAKAFLFLADRGFCNSGATKILNTLEAKRINALMLTCGFYDESGEFAFEVGLPGKSGVGGGIITVNPDNYCLAVWSPRLNEKGNSYRALQFLEKFTTLTQSSIF